MAKEMIVLQGKSFSIDLQSMLGSTCWGWCLTRLPQGIALIGMETIPTAAGVAPVIQRFWFGALSAVKDKAEIGFTLINLSDMTSAKQKVDVNVTVIPKDSEDFAKFSENCDDAVDPVCNSAMPYGVVLGNRSVAFKYGYPVEPTVKYGYPGAQDTAQCCDDSCNSSDPCDSCDPCVTQPVAFKYGYPNQNMKYGYPDVNFKYGYPYGWQDATQCCDDSCARSVSFIYGYPNQNIKYGYPDINLKYGFPRGDAKPVVAYGFPRVKYGFICDLKKKG